MATSAAAPPSRDDIARLAEQFEGQPPEAVLRWAVATFHPRLTLACSFGVEDMMLADMLHRLQPGADVFYLDTGLLFPETYALRDKAADRYDLAFRQVLPQQSVAEQAESYGDKLWAREPDRCCALRKVEPLGRALAGYDAWITGLRREQSPTRAGIRVVEWDERFGLVKLNPLAALTMQDVWRYVADHDVPYNELHDQGYPSIGCWPCTRAVRPGEDTRAGRWAGLAKTECGLHVAGGVSDAG